MQYLFMSSIKYQRAAFLASASAGKMMSDCYMRFLEQQYELFQHVQTHRRSDVKDRAPGNRNSGKACPPFDGADLLDHYGKRANDVDVEHI